MLTNLVSILQHANLLTCEQEREVIAYIKQHNCCVPDALISLDIIGHQRLTEQLSLIFKLQNTNLTHFDYEPLCKQLGLRALITRYQALPIASEEQTLTIAISDPTHLQVEHEFRFATGLQIELVLADYKALQAAIRRLYGQEIQSTAQSGKEISQDELADLVTLSDSEQLTNEDLSLNDSPVSRFINQILLDAVRKGASDIHFEPYEAFYRVRLRCDGILIETQRPSNHLSRRLAARIKILAHLNIAERRLPQDGRINLSLTQKTTVDVRVSTLPTLWGEKIVLRLLNCGFTRLDIDQLGYNDIQKQLYLEALQKPQGMILMTGPTGSGKSISLYTGLHILNSPQINISTAEDPVEINLSGVNQVQIQTNIGFGFPQALRSFLRQDPDVIMVGEIRDLETAEMAVKAAQTGHLVLSTLHTNSAAEAIVRLNNMGIKAFNLASSLHLVIAQRLARCLCHHCKIAMTPSKGIILQFNLSPDEIIYEANLTGCNECTKGYSGRVGIYEVMAFNDHLSEAIMQKVPTAQLEKIAIANGMQTLQNSGIEKLKQGVTSLKELQRIIYF